MQPSTVTNTQNHATVEQMAPHKLTQDLERAERDLIAALYSIWHLQGKRKRIVTEKRR